MHTKTIHWIWLVVLLACNSRAVGAQTEALLGLEVCEESWTSASTARGAYISLVFGKDGRLAQVGKRWNATGGQNAPYTVALGQYSVLPNGHLALTHTRRGPWEGTWYLSDTRLIMGALVRSGPQAWSCRYTDSRFGGDSRLVGFDLQFDEQPVLGERATGVITLFRGQDEPRIRQFEASSNEELWVLRDVTGGASSSRLPRFELYPGDGYGNVRGVTGEYYIAKVSGPARTALAAVDFPFHLGRRWSTPNDVLVGRVFEGARPAYPISSEATSQLVFGEEKRVGSVVHDANDSAGASYLERSIGTFRVLSGNRLSINVGTSAWVGTFFVTKDALYRSAVVQTSTTTWIYEHSDGTLEPHLWKFRIEFDQPATFGQPATGEIHLNFKGRAPDRTVRFRTHGVGPMTVFEAVGTEDPELELPTLRFLDGEPYALRRGKQGATLELKAIEIDPVVERELNSEAFPFGTRQD